MVAERIERPRGSLVNKLRWPIVISVAVALLIVGYVLIYISTQAQRQDVFRVQQRTAEEIAMSTFVYLQDAGSDLTLFAQVGDLVALERAEQQAALERLLTRRRDVYDEITLLDQDGNEIVKVSRFHTFLPAELGSQADTAVFQQARKGMDYMDKEVAISPYSGLPIVEMAVPVHDPVSGDVTGALVAQVSIKHMWDEVASVEVGERGYAYVVNTAGRLLAHADLTRYLQLQGEQVDHVPLVEKIVKMGIVELAAEEYTGLDGERVVGAYAPIGETSWVTIVELPAAEAYASLQQMRVSLVGLLVVAVLAIGGLTSWLPQRIIRPLAQLEQGAMLLSSGQLEHRIALRTGDELEALGSAFNQMAGRLQELYAGLEQKVADRTRDLEQRSLHLEAAAQVAREAAAIRDVGQLLDATVRLISERFGFYHAGIFLLDEREEHAVLQAASSEGGQQMLVRGHKLKVGEVGIVGHAAGTGEPRIALDVGADAVFFDNPDLPNTRSEMGLPLKVRERVIGVLDVQSTEEGAFSDEDVAILQTMADQVALAIENTRLLEESQHALRELEALHGQRAREAWRERAASQPAAYRYTSVGVEPAPPSLALEMEAPPLHSHPVIIQEGDGRRLIAPIRLRGQTFGSIALRQDPEGASWSDEEIALVEELSTQIGLALENARLLEETRLRAEREQLMGKITARMRETLDVDTILQTAISEIGEALGMPEIEVRMGSGVGDHSPARSDSQIELTGSSCESKGRSVCLPREKGSKRHE